MIAIPKLLLLWTVVFFLVWILLMLFKPKYTMGIVEKLVKTPELSFLFGFMLMILSFLYLLVYVKLDGTWYMLFSILGYLTLLKWIAMVAFPNLWATQAKRFYGTVTMTRIMWGILLCVAIFVFFSALFKF